MRRPVRAGVAALAAAGSLALAGCGRVDTALSREWATVSFRADTPTATVAAVQAACPGRPGLRPAPVPVVPGTGDAPFSLRYDASHATAADLARFQHCLMQFPDVVLGVSLKDVAGQG